MKDFLTAHWRSLDDVYPSSSYKSEAKTSKHAAPSKPGRAMVGTETQKEPSKEQVVCNASHYIAKCQRFLDMSVEVRRKVVTDAGLCWNCLSNGHLKGACKSMYSCRE